MGMMVQREPAYECNFDLQGEAALLIAGVARGCLYLMRPCSV